jgi:hypothetical protein
MPVYEARLVYLVFHPDAKWLADISRNAECPIRLPDAEHGSRLVVDLDTAALQSEHGL